MKKPFVYGTSVEGENFTDRVKETARLKLDFENGVNCILISPRRMGKTSLVDKVCREITNPAVKTICMDVYDCRSEYDFLERFATTIIKQTAGKMEQLASTVTEFLGRVVPKVSFSPEPNSEFSLSLGITPETAHPDEILNLPERIAERKGIHLVICIDEFQQIGEFPDTLNVQKRMRGAWQHHKHVSYCMYGSKKHLMMKIFQSSRMPFYKFGDTMFLGKIPDADWVAYIQARFASKGKIISADLAARICHVVDGYSSYVQELAWNVFAETDEVATEESISAAIQELLRQNSALFQSRIESLTSFQINFLRALADGVHSDYGSTRIISTYRLGSKSNISRLKTSLEDKELVETAKGITTFADPIFALWFKNTYM